MQKIFSLIDETQHISDTRKIFYQSILQYGYDLVLRPAYNKI